MQQALQVLRLQLHWRPEHLCVALELEQLEQALRPFPLQGRQVCAQFLVLEVLEQTQQELHLGHTRSGFHRSPPCHAGIRAGKGHPSCK